MLAALLVTVLFAADPARPTIVLAVGAEGTPEFGRQFQEWVRRWEEAGKQAEANVVKVEQREALEQVLGTAAKESVMPLWLVLIGHGTYDGREAKFNLSGPDVSDRELAQWLKPSSRPLAVINCTSASGPFLKALAAPGRVVITATRSGNEHNFARFGDYFSAAISDPAADLDKDEQTSLLEAYLAAVHRTEEFYKQDARLATEHALLDDNGDGLGTPAEFFQGVRAARRAKDGATLDGARAHQWCLLLSTREQNMSSEARQRRDDLELQVEALREKKDSLQEQEYYAQLEVLLLELARLYAGQGKMPVVSR